MLKTFLCCQVAQDYQGNATGRVPTRLACEKMDSYALTRQTWNKVAAMYQDKVMDEDLFADTYDTFCQLLQAPRPSILEIGCGPGNITRYLLSKRPDCVVEAIDAAPAMVRLAGNNNPQACCKVMDARDIDRLAGKYDAIMCGFCMPYLSREDCAKLIKDSSGLLHKAGIFYFSTLEGPYQKSGYETGSNKQDQMYVYYHQEDFLTQKLQENNFTLIHLIRRDYPGANGPLATMIFIVRKQ